MFDAPRLHSSQGGASSKRDGIATAAPQTLPRGEPEYDAGRRAARGSRDADICGAKDGIPPIPPIWRKSAAKRGFFAAARSMLLLGATSSLGGPVKR